MPTRGAGKEGTGAGEDPASLSYTEASRELDEIVAFFEGEEVDIDQLVARLERATVLVDELDRRLRRTRAQVEELVPRLAGATGPIDAEEIEAEAEAFEEDAEPGDESAPGLF